MTCTNALGMGQNWTDTQSDHWGMLDPLEALQMDGCGGRDGQHAMYFLLVKDQSRADKDSVKGLSNPTEHNNNHWMYAMAITQVCLRVEFVVLLRYVLSFHVVLEV